VLLLKDEEGVQMEWHEPLANVAAAEQSSSEVVLHLRGGGLRFVPCDGGAPVVRSTFQKVDAALRRVSAPGVVAASFQS
jgi:hypothetical protein